MMINQEMEWDDFSSQSHISPHSNASSQFCRVKRQKMLWQPLPQARYRHTAVVCGDAVPLSEGEMHGEEGQHFSVGDEWGTRSGCSPTIVAIDNGR